MIRRPPTRIELRLEDLQEYENLKRELELVKSVSNSDSMQETPVAKTKQQMAGERLGLVGAKSNVRK